MVALLVVVLLAAVVLAVVRFVRGPTDADRIIALDILFAVGVALCVAAALATQRVEFFDVAIGVALVGFVATLAWSRLVEVRRAPPAGGS